jgi:hypothetical protein
MHPAWKAYSDCGNVDRSDLIDFVDPVHEQQMRLANRLVDVALLMAAQPGTM